MLVVNLALMSVVGASVIEDVSLLQAKNPSVGEQPDEQHPQISLAKTISSPWQMSVAEDCQNFEDGLEEYCYAKVDSTDYEFVLIHEEAWTQGNYACNGPIPSPENEEQIVQLDCTEQISLVELGKNDGRKQRRGQGIRKLKSNCRRRKKGRRSLLQAKMTIIAKQPDEQHPQISLAKTMSSPWQMSLAEDCQNFEDGLEEYCYAKVDSTDYEFVLVHEEEWTPGNYACNGPIPSPENEEQIVQLDCTEQNSLVELGKIDSPMKSRTKRGQGASRCKLGRRR